MKILALLGAVTLALSLCSITDKIQEKLKGSSPQSNSSSSNSTNSSPTTSSTNSSSTASKDTESAEKPKLTAEQQSITDSAEETKWDDQGMSWKLPKGWKKMNATKDSFNYSSPDQAFLLVNISNMSNNFPAETSLKATYDSDIEQMKNGKYENVRYVEIDGVKGVEFIETMPEDKSGPRRHQWIAYRPYNGQIQMLNVMLSTKGSNFDKHRDDFPAVLYSMKINK